MEPRALSKKRTPAKKRASPSSPFLSLPGEIRNYIYEILLVLPKSIEPRGPWQVGSKSYPSYPYSQYRSSLAIAFTCKQIKAEALSIFYGTNTFWLGTVEEMRNHLELNFQDAGKFLTRVEFDYEGHIRVPGFKALADLPNLQRLQINIDWDTTAGSSIRDRNDLLKARGLGQLKKIRGCKEVIVSRMPVAGSAPHPPRFSEAQLEKLGDTLRKELCKPRGTK